MIEIYRNLLAVDPVVLISVHSLTSDQSFDFKFRSHDDGLSVVWPTSLGLAAAIKAASPHLDSPEREDKADLGIIPKVSETGSRLLSIRMSSSVLFNDIDASCTERHNKARINIGRTMLGWDQSDDRDTSGLSGDMVFKDAYYRPNLVAKLMSVTAPEVCLAEIPDILAAADTLTAFHLPATEERVV